MAQNRQKVKVNPFTFWPKFGHFWDFFQSPFSRDIYIQWSSNDDKNAFQWPERSFSEPFEKISKMAQNRQKVKVNPFTFWAKFGHFWDFFQSPFSRENKRPLKLKPR